MNNINQQINTILSSAAFQNIMKNDVLKVGQLNAAITLLIQAGIPFDLEYSSGTRREAAAAALSIYINPTTTLQFVITFEAGGSVFGGDPNV